MAKNGFFYGWTAKCKDIRNITLNVVKTKCFFIGTRNNISLLLSNSGICLDGHSKERVDSHKCPGIQVDETLITTNYIPVVIYFFNLLTWIATIYVEDGFQTSEKTCFIFENGNQYCQCQVDGNFGKLKETVFRNDGNFEDSIQKEVNLSAFICFTRFCHY